MDIFSSTRSRSIKLTSKNQSHSFSRSNTAEYGSLVWTFDSNNHFLHPALVNLVSSKVVLSAVAITLVPMLFVTQMPIHVMYMYFVAVNGLVIIPFLLLTTLSFNRDASGFIIKSSEFWIKIAYGVAKAALLFARYHLVPALQEEAPVYLGYGTFGLGLVAEPLVMVAIGGIDAIPRMTHNWKALLMGLAAMFYTMEAIKYQFLEPRESDCVITIQATRSDISLNSLVANVSGVMSIFLWKQAIDVLRNKDRCISITYRPYLRWTESADVAELIDRKQMPESIDVVKAAVDKEDARKTRNRGFSILNS